VAVDGVHRLDDVAEALGVVPAHSSTRSASVRAHRIADRARGHDVDPCAEDLLELLGGPAELEQADVGGTFDHTPRRVLECVAPPG